MIYFQGFKHVFLFLPVFSVFMNIYTGYVCIWAYWWVNKKKLLTYMYLPYFSVACYANTTTKKFFLPNPYTCTCFLNIFYSKDPSNYCQSFPVTNSPVHESNSLRWLLGRSHATNKTVHIYNVGP